MRNRKTTKGTVIFYCITAALWSIAAISKFFEQTYTSKDRFMGILFAVVWILCAITQYMRYKKDNI